MADGPKEEKVNLKESEKTQDKSSFWKKFKETSGENRFVNIGEERIEIVAMNWRFEPVEGFDRDPLKLDVISVDGEEQEMVEEKDKNGKVIRTHHPELSITAGTLMRGLRPFIEEAEMKGKNVIQFSAKKVIEAGRTRYDVEKVKERPQK